MLVHRRFGRSRRISETDKKQMATLMATQVQSTKEACRRQLDQAHSSREQLEHAIQDVESKVSGLNNRVQQFVRSHNDVFKEAPVLDMRSTTQALLGMTRSESQTPILQLEEQLDFLLTRFNRLLTERACMVNDRQKMSEVLRLKLTGPVTDPIVDKLSKVREENEALVKYLRQKVINLEEKVNASQASVEEKEKIIARLRADMEGLEKELDTFKQNIESMTSLPPDKQSTDGVAERRKVMNSNSAPCMTSVEKKWSSSSGSSVEMYQSKGNNEAVDGIERLNLPPIHPGTPKASPMTTRKFHRCSGTDRRT